MLDFAVVASWLADAADDDLAEIADWLDDLEFGDGLIGFQPSDLDGFWDTLERLSGGTMHHAFERDARGLVGQIAELADLATPDSEDVPDLVSIRFREHLRSSGRSPTGVWEAALLADMAHNATIAFDVWAQVDPEPAREQLRSEMHAMLESCRRLSSEMRSLAGQRLLASTSSLCLYRLGRFEESIERAGSFFRLERQCRRESGSLVSLDELVAATAGGVNSYASLGDADGVAEVMRRVRILAEPAGGVLQPVFLHVWSNAMMSLDPAFAQMLALQRLNDVQEATGAHSDEALGAALTLMEATALAGDGDAANQLAEEWAPLALNAEHGPGAQMWINSINLDNSDDS